MGRRVRFGIIDKNLKNGRNFLDVGCGDGYYLEGLKNRFQQLIGIDVNKNNIKIAKKRINKSRRIRLIIADGKDIPLKEKFDTVICSEVLEHVLEPHIMVREISNVLRRGGSLLLTVPEKTMPMQDDHVVSGYEYGELEKMLSASDLIIVKNSYFLKRWGYFLWRLEKSITRINPITFPLFYMLMGLDKYFGGTGREVFLKAVRR